MKKILLMLGAFTVVASAQAQQTVSTNGQKHVIIEEATGNWCGYCPDGAAIVETIKALPRAIGVSVHGYTGTGDAMIVPDGDALNNARPMDLKSPPYTSADSDGVFCQGYPNATIDRTMNAVSRNAWPSAVNSQMSVAAKTDLTMTHTYDKATRKLDITVTVKTLSALTGEYRVNVYILEDSIASESNLTGYYQKSYHYNDAASPWYHKGTLISGSTYGLSSTQNGYWHNNVLRAMLGGTWGTSGVIPNNAATGQTYTKNYTYTLPAGFKPEHIRLVALVQAFKADDYTARKIDNGVEAKFIAATGVSSFKNESKGFYVYPNPATHNIEAKAILSNNGDVVVTLSNLTGQVVFTKKYTVNNNLLEATIPVGDLANGIYLINVKSDAVNGTQKITVSH